MEVEEGINGNGKIQFPKADTTEEVIFKKLMDQVLSLFLPFNFSLAPPVGKNRAQPDRGEVC